MVEARTYPSLGARVFRTYLDTMPLFAAAPAAPADAAQQEAAYRLLRTLYERGEAQPSRFGLSEKPDDCLDDWEMQKNKPRLAADYRAQATKLDELLEALRQALLRGCYAQDRLYWKTEDAPCKPALYKKLAGLLGAADVESGQAGVCLPSDAYAGLLQLAKSAEEICPDRPALPFSRGIFGSAAGLRTLFESRLGDERAMRYILDFLEQEGYRRQALREHHFTVSLDYAKCYAAKDEPLKSNWAERVHGGVELLYEPWRGRPAQLGLRVPYFKELLQRADELDERSKRFLLRTAKKCDHCRYCVQTDKTGRRPLASCKVEGLALCPMFCGFQFRWREVDGALAEDIVALLQGVDRMFKDKMPECGIHSL